MQSRQLAGFTVVELIIIIVLLGILAAIAMPRFLNLSSNSQQAAITNLATALATASSDNFARRTANSSQGSAIAKCSDIVNLLPSSLPTGYSVNNLAITAGSSATCTLTGPSGATATFRGLGIS